jgi:hypothetical protein
MIPKTQNIKACKPCSRFQPSIPAIMLQKTKPKTFSNFKAKFSSRGCSKGVCSNLVVKNLGSSMLTRDRSLSLLPVSHRLSIDRSFHARRTSVPAVFCHLVSSSSLSHLGAPQYSKYKHLPKLELTKSLLVYKKNNQLTKVAFPYKPLVFAMSKCNKANLLKHEPQKARIQKTSDLIVSQSKTLKSSMSFHSTAPLKICVACPQTKIKSSASQNARKTPNTSKSRTAMTNSCSSFEIKKEPAFVDVYLAFKDKQIICHLPSILSRMDVGTACRSPFDTIACPPSYNAYIDLKASFYNFIAKCTHSLELKDRVWFLAVDLFDKVNIICQVKSECLEITALACLIIASKFESVRSPRLITFLRCSGSSSTRQQVAAVEESILKMFDFRVVSILSYDYYIIFSQLAGLPDKAKELGSFMLKIFLCGLKRYRQDREVVAFAVCLFLSRRFKVPQFWQSIKRNETDFFSLCLGSPKSQKSLQKQPGLEKVSEYLFEVSATEQICDQITESCIRCHVEDYFWIFQLFNKEKDQKGQILPFN